MFEFLIEMDQGDLQLGVDKLSLANIEINGNHGYLSSDGQAMMIFISLSDLLCGISSFIVNNKKQYIFEGVDCSFRFFVFNSNGTIHITDSKKNEVVETNTTEFIQSIWRGVDKFFTKYRPYFENDDDVISHLDRTLDKFKIQFADILNKKVLK